MVFETTGGVNKEGLELLRQLFQPSTKASVVRGHVSRAICNLLYLNVFLIVRVVWLR